MHVTARALCVIGLAGVMFPALGGCGKKDPTLDAAPPPSPGAVVEPTRQKNMPGPLSPTKAGGGAQPGAGGLQGPAAKPPGM